MIQIFTYSLIFAVLVVGGWAIWDWILKTYIRPADIAKLGLEEQSIDLTDVGEVLKKEEDLDDQYEELKYQFGEKRLKRVVKRTDEGGTDNVQS